MAGEHKNLPYALLIFADIILFVYLSQTSALSNQSKFVKIL